MKHFTLFLTLISLVSAAVAIPPPVRPPRHAGAAFPPAPKMKRSRTPNVWWAFSRLSPAEQKELMELQRKDPEKFRSVMQEKSAELQEELQAKRKKTAELGEKIRTCKDEKEKAELRKQLRAQIKANFDNRIASLRRMVEANKKRIEQMEADLKKREQNSEAIIDTITNFVISGQNLPKQPPSAPAGHR